MPSQDFGPSTQQSDTSLAREALPSGTRLGGYQIIDVLGRGGFGIVYLALDSSLQRQLAIKEYLPADLATRRDGPQVVLKAASGADAFAAGKAAFLAEARLLSRLEHPSLAHVHSFWEENDTAYMVMPYYEGHTLAAALAAQKQPPDEAWLRALLTPLLSALHVLHSAQCYHRDISPDNIFMLADGRPVLLDFAASNRVAGDDALALGKLLNPAYAPIEQYSESATLPQGPWTDLYALASVLHFAITGQAPVPAPLRVNQDPQRPLADTVRALQARFPGLHYDYSEAFLAGIDKALSVRPRERPRDVGDFQKILDRAPLQASIPITPEPRREPVFDPPPVREEWFTASTTPPHAAAAPPRRSASLWVAALGMLALAAVGGWWWTTQMLPAAPTPVAAAAAPMAPAASAMSASAVALPAEPAASVADPIASAPAAAASEAALPASAPASAVAAPPAEPASAAEVVALVETPAEPPVRSKKAKAAASAPADAETPRAACGSRANFSLVYCMQQQCKRTKFAYHPQCIEMKQRGEL
ncbi:MAG TPA: serine/threonine-protein kinase [Rhizobacter sp.]|nr:serine/threonine-protein kinase [Rhizobacter sp.]